MTVPAQNEAAILEKLSIAEYNSLIAFWAAQNFDTYFAAYIADNPTALDAAIAAYLADHAITGGETGRWISGGSLLSSFTSGATGPVAATESSTNKVNRIVMQFTNSGAKEYGEFGMRLPEQFESAHTVTATFFWSAPGTGTESVVWGAQGLALTDGDAIDTAYGTAQEVTDAHTASADNLRISDATAAITIAGTPAAGKWVTFRFYRDSSNGSDTLAQTCDLIGVYVSWA